MLYRRKAPESLIGAAMDLEVTPDPSPDERAALERALAESVGKAADPRSAWWREGLREDMDEDQSQSS